LLPYPNLGIVTENSTMRKFLYSTRKQNISSAIYAIRNYTQDLVYLYIACKFIRRQLTKYLTPCPIGQMLI